MTYAVFQKNPEAGAKKTPGSKIPLADEKGKKSGIKSKIKNQEQKTYSGNISQPEKGSPKKNKTKEITQKKGMARILKRKNEGDKSNPGEKFTIKWGKNKNEQKSREQRKKNTLFH